MNRSTTLGNPLRLLGRLALWQQVLIGLILGVVAGLLLKQNALIAAIDRILDMARTTVNVAGDLMATALVGRSENELDSDIYNSASKD